MPIPMKRFNTKSLKKYSMKTKKYKTKLPSSLRVSRKRYSVAKQVSRALASYGETKIRGNNLKCLEPIVKPGTAGAPTSYVFANAGQSINSLLPEFPTANALDLFNFPATTSLATPQTRIGNYMYLRQGYLKMEIQMMPINTNDSRNALNTTVSFRLMVVKCNRKYNRLGAFPDPGGLLFRSTNGNPVGYDSGVVDAFEFMNQPINKQQFQIYCDKRFTLSPPSVLLDNDGAGLESTNLQNPKYPIKKRIDVKLPVWRKCYFPNDQNQPSNLDTQWMIICQAVYTAYCDSSTAAPPLDWRLNIYASATGRDS